MNEEKIKKAIDDYFERNRPALQKELADLNKEYKARKLEKFREEHREILRSIDDKAERLLAELFNNAIKRIENK